MSALAAASGVEFAPVINYTTILVALLAGAFGVYYRLKDKRRMDAADAAERLLALQEKELRFRESELDAVRRRLNEEKQEKLAMFDRLDVRPLVGEMSEMAKGFIQAQTSADSRFTEAMRVLHEHDAMVRRHDAKSDEFHARMTKAMDAITKRLERLNGGNSR